MYNPLLTFEREREREKLSRFVYDNNIIINNNIVRKKRKIEFTPV